MAFDFFHIKQKAAKGGVLEVFPDFKVGKSTDLMVRGKGFYAIWDEDRGRWSTDEYDVQRLVDRELLKYRNETLTNSDHTVIVKTMSDFSTGSWAQFRAFMNHISDNATPLDMELTFANTTRTKKDYCSKELPYPLEKGTCSAFEELIGTLYDPEERQKLEWAIGSIVAGDSKWIQKFIVLYGEAGGGKSTILNIIQMLFNGYYTIFEAKALTTNGNSFSTEAFKGNPLVAIQHDGDLSRIEDNTRLNSIVSHEEIIINEKYKPGYAARVNCFLFVGTNKPVKITDAKSGIIRRLIDVRTSGRKIPVKRYNTLMTQVQFELGAIAQHCLDVYLSMGKNYYSGYRPLDMILQTDTFYNFVENYFYQFRSADKGVTLSQAYELYKLYCEEAALEFKMPRHKFREELKNYFRYFDDVGRVDDKQVRSLYREFLHEKFTQSSPMSDEPDETALSLVLDQSTSILDSLYSDCPAQYANMDELPSRKWVSVDTTLSDINTALLHYVKPPENHIVIDFDIKDSDGNKSFRLNLLAASNWPPTYAEVSKGGNGIHLHYIYDGDITKLKGSFSDGIEVKTFNGDASLRRKHSFSNNVPVAHISSGLPLKGEKMLDITQVQSEKGLKALIERNLRKEIHPGTKPSIDFIHKILEDAYSSGIRYDLTPMRPKILSFAMNSTNQAAACVKIVSTMKFKSEDPDEELPSDGRSVPVENLTFFDIEVFPNLFLVCWKQYGEGKSCVRMINPTAHEIEELLKHNLVGFNCRRYDNHILYAAFLGYTNTELYELSQRIISGSQNAMFREGYGLSYVDVYDFSTEKKSLKMFEVELGIRHSELGLPWDKPVDEELWHIVADYCDNDVVATEEVFKSRLEDYKARLILSELSGLSVNDTTHAHTARIIFGTDQNPQSQFIYTDLREMFPGYIFDNGVSTYKGRTVGEGGFVYSRPGIYYDVALLDVASMHPASIEALNLFGDRYTKRFSDLKRLRIAIKHNDLDTVRTIFDGRIAKYIDSEDTSLGSLAYALKIGINIVYGLTAAKFDNRFRDTRNKDNIVAKRGALFMIDLLEHMQYAEQEVCHIKTDSIKLPGASPDVVQMVMDFGNLYGYEFEHEATYSKMCLVNDAVYVAKYGPNSGKNSGKWTATGAEFQHPFVFKSLFSKEPIEFKDLCEVKAVTSALYLDMNEDLPEGEHNYVFVGKVGEFVPVKAKSGGGILVREKDGKYSAATGSKGYRWMLAEDIIKLGKEKAVDRSYHKKLVDDAIAHIAEFGDPQKFFD